MIEITDRGAEKVREFLDSQQADLSVAGLRVGVRGGGCSGFQYQLAFDEQRESDRVFESHGLKLLVDGEGLQFVAARRSTTRRACRAPASRSKTPTSSPPAAAAPPSGSPRRSRSQRSEPRLGPAGRSSREPVAILPQELRRLTPDRLRDDVRARSAALWLGLIPPRTMHSERDAGVLLAAARGARRVVEIGVYEGASAVALCGALGPDAELHLIDPFGSRPDALPSGWRGVERASRRAVARACRRAGARAPRVRWHIALSHEVAAGWEGPVDLVFIDGDHSEAGCERDWLDWAPPCRRRPRRLPRRARRPRGRARPAGAHGGRPSAACAAPGGPAGRSPQRPIARSRCAVCFETRVDAVPQV